MGGPGRRAGGSRGVTVAPRWHNDSVIAGIVLQSVGDELEGSYVRLKYLVDQAFEAGEVELARTLDRTRERLREVLNELCGYEAV